MFQMEMSSQEKTGRLMVSQTTTEIRRSIQSPIMRALIQRRAMARAAGNAAPQTDESRSCDVEKFSTPQRDQQPRHQPQPGPRNQLRAPVSSGPTSSSPAGTSSPQERSCSDPQTRPTTGNHNKTSPKTSQGKPRMDLATLFQIGRKQRENEGGLLGNPENLRKALATLYSRPSQRNDGGADTQMYLDLRHRLQLLRKGAEGDRQVRGNNDPLPSPPTPIEPSPDDDEDVLQIHVGAEDDPENWLPPVDFPSPPPEPQPKRVTWKEGIPEQPWSDRFRGKLEVLRTRRRLGLRIEPWEMERDERMIERAFQRPPRTLKAVEEVSIEPEEELEVPTAQAESEKQCDATGLPDSSSARASEDEEDDLWDENAAPPVAPPNPPTRREFGGPRPEVTPRPAAPARRVPDLAARGQAAGGAVPRRGGAHRGQRGQRRRDKRVRDRRTRCRECIHWGHRTEDCPYKGMDEIPCRVCPDRHPKLMLICPKYPLAKNQPTSLRFFDRRDDPNFGKPR